MEAYIRLRLRQMPLFGGLPDQELQRLSRAALVRELRKGQILFRQGEPGRAVYWLDAGRVQLSRQTAGGRQVIIRTVRPGELFAEAALFEEQRYPVTARAATASRLVGLWRGDFLELLSVASFRDAFLGLLMRRLRYLTERLEQVASASVEARLARFLFEQYGRATAAEVEFSKQDVAAAIGITPETLSRLLRRLRRRRLLQWRRRTLTIALAFWAEFAPSAL